MASFTDQDIQSSLIAMGAAPVTTDSAVQGMAIAKSGPAGVVTTGPVVGQTQLGQDITVQSVKNTQGADAQAWLELNAKREREAAEAEKRRVANFQPEKVAGYTDSNGVYHPPTVTNAGPTIGQAYSSATSSSSSSNGSELDAAYDAYGNMIKGTQGPIDEEAIRNATMSKFQAEIDAVNRYYAEQRDSRFRAEDRLGEARLGTGSAIQARRGLLGSDFGAAQTDKINMGTEENKRAIGATIEAERLAQVQDILGQARTMSDQEIADKEAARKAGATEYINFLKDSATRKEERSTSAMAALISQGVEPDEGTIKSLAKELGISEKDFKAKFATVKKDAEVNARKGAQTKEVNGVLYQEQADGTYLPVTPEATEKPIIVDGAAYERQADGSYKAVIEKTVEPITKTVGKVIYSSVDGGLTWKNAMTGAAAPKTVRNSPAPTKKAPTETQAAAEMTKELSQVVGADNFIAPETYDAAKNAWINAGYSPTSFDTKFKGFRNPENQYYKVGG